MTDPPSPAELETVRLLGPSRPGYRFQVHLLPLEWTSLEAPACRHTSWVTSCYGQVYLDNPSSRSIESERRYGFDWYSPQAPMYCLPDPVPTWTGKTFLYDRPLAVWVGAGYPARAKGKFPVFEMEDLPDLTCEVGQGWIRPFEDASGLLNAYAIRLGKWLLNQPFTPDDPVWREVLCQIDLACRFQHAYSALHLHFFPEHREVEEEIVMRSRTGRTLEDARAALMEGWKTWADSVPNAEPIDKPSTHGSPP